MSRPLSTLLVEDSEDDALLVLEALRRDGYAPIFERVQTAGALRAALLAKQWDVVLCDYMMPGFDARAALRIVQESHQELPVIVLSGTVGEDTAVETIKLGAADYLMKDRLARLGQSVGHTLEEQRLRRERKLTDVALKESVAKLHGILSAAPVGIGRVSDRILLEVNEAMVQMLGYSREELNGQDARILYETDEDYHSAGRQYLQLREENKISFETRFIAKSGRIIDVAITAVWLDAANPAAGVVFAVMDISERKRTEQARDHSLSLLRATLESTADGILVVNNEGKVETFNSTFSRMWRLPEEVLATRNDAQALQYILKQLSEPNKFLEKIAYLYSHPEAESFDSLDFQDGRVFERYSRPQFVGGKVVGRVWSFRDITERRIAVEALRASEERYRNLIDEARDAIFTLSANGKILAMNQAVRKIMGWRCDMWLGGDFTEPLRPVNREIARTRFEEVLRGDHPAPFELQLLNPEGLMITLEFAVSPQLQNGRIVGVLGVGRDITERKTAEEALRSSEDKFSIAFRESPVAMTIRDFESNRYIDANNKCLAMRF